MFDTLKLLSVTASAMKPVSDHIHCQNCNFSHLCLPLALKDDELETLDRIVKRNRPLQKNDVLTQENKAVTALYAVRSGAFKSYITDQQGNYQITGFHLPGDIIGLDSIGTAQHLSTARALETSMVCEIPNHLLDDASHAIPKLKHQLMTFMSQEIHEHKQNMMLLNVQKAESRLIYFLLSLSRRFALRGLSSVEFFLPMTRSDLGNHLGLTIETVSRSLSKLQNLGFITVDGKLVTLLDTKRMEAKLEDQKVNLPKVG